MAGELIPIWLHTEVDELLAGTIVVQADGSLNVLLNHDDQVTDFMQHDIRAGKLQAVVMHLQYVDPTKPRTTEQIEYLKKVLPYTVGGKVDDPK